MNKYIKIFSIWEREYNKEIKELKKSAEKTKLSRRKRIIKRKKKKEENPFLQSRSGENWATQ